jgi:sporulation protein YlmC with PRC-barrel domain
VPDPIAWTEIESGWKVADADGKEIGKVSEVRGDVTLDIFDGLTIRRGILKGDTYVPAEHVSAIYEGEIELALAQNEIESLPAQ